MSDKIKILVVGCGHMGASHAAAYDKMQEFEICGLVSRGESKSVLNEKLGNKYALYADYYEALSDTHPDAVCISTYPDTHEEYALMALEAGCHVFIEKPLATTVEGSKRIIEKARAVNKKVVIGYILRHHPMWQQFIEKSHLLGKPLVMRMNLNQQSSGENWETHLNLMKSVSPIVDCGVHYLDVMCQMTEAKPVKVNAMGTRLSDQVSANNYNYGQLQIWFDDGSIGWYEVGWGPMVSDTAHFIKDVFGPKGSVSIVPAGAAFKGKSDDVNAHTETEDLLFHSADTNEHGAFMHPDERISFAENIGHQELCDREQQYFLRAIQGKVDLTSHWQDAIFSLQIALAADESVRKGEPVFLI